MKNVVSFRAPWASVHSLKRGVRVIVFKTLIYLGMLYATIMVAHPFVKTINHKNFLELLFYFNHSSWLAILPTPTEPVFKFLILIFIGNYLRNKLFSYFVNVLGYIKWENMYYKSNSGQIKQSGQFQMVVNQTAHFISLTIVSVLSGVVYYMSFLNSLPLILLDGMQMGCIFTAVVMCNGSLFEKIELKLKSLRE